MAAKNKPNEIYITRLYDAPVKTVWEAWVDPEKVAKWWGPRGFTLTTKSKDVRTGGSWVYTMHGPDGVDWPNITQFLEVEKYKKMIYDHGGNETQPPLFRVTVEFTDVKGKTKMDMTMSFANVEIATQSKKFIKDAGGNSTWDRLAEFLAKESSGKEHFVINRSFDAPLNVMYEVWSDPKHFQKWLPPTGMTMEFIRADVRPGGSSFYFMTDGKDLKMYGSVKYIEMNKPHQLKYTQDFRDKDEKISRHPFAPTWPETLLTTVDLTEEGPHQTRVTITWEPHGQVTREELEAFIKEKSGMTMGWTGSFDKLEAYLEKLK